MNAVVRGLLLLVAVVPIIVSFLVQKQQQQQQQQQQQPLPLPLPRVILFDTSKFSKKTNVTIWKYLGTQDDITNEYKDYLLDVTKQFIKHEEKVMKKKNKKKKHQRIDFNNKIVNKIPNYYHGNDNYIDFFEWKFSNKSYRVYIYDDDDDDDEYDDDDDDEYDEVENECIFSSSLNGDDRDDRDEQVLLPRFHFLGSCNDIHQIDIVPSSTSTFNSNSNTEQRQHYYYDYPEDHHFTYIHSGGQRSVYKIYIPQYNTISSTSSSSSQSTTTTNNNYFYFALKMNRYDKPYKSKRYDETIYDTNVMERLTNSPYIANIYSSCGLSQIVEYSPYGNLHTVISKSRKKRSNNNTQLLTSLQKLKIAYQLSKSVTDIQQHGYGISHLDIGIHQYLYFVDNGSNGNGNDNGKSGGIYKLNDFGQGKYMMVPNNKHKKQQQHRKYQHHVVKKKKTLLLEEEEEDDDDLLLIRTNNNTHQQTDDHDDAIVTTTTTTTKPDYCHTTEYIYNSEQLKYYPPELVFAKMDNENGKEEKKKKNDNEEQLLLYLDISKIDTYMMATTMYSVVTNKWMYEGYTQQEVYNMMKDGIGPSFEVPTTTSSSSTSTTTTQKKPEEEEAEDDEEIEIILIKAIQAGLQMDPIKRSTAKEISDYLYHSLIKQLEKEKRRRQQQKNVDYDRFFCENNNNYSSIIAITTAPANTTSTTTCTLNNNDNDNNNNNNNNNDEEESSSSSSFVDNVVVRVTVPSNLMLKEEENEDQDEDDFWYDAELWGDDDG